MRILRPFAVIVFLAIAAWPQLLSGGIDDIAIDAQGNILVAVGDSYQVFKVAPDGDVSVFAGTGRQRDYNDPGGGGGPATAAELRYPYSVTVDPRTNEVYIADDTRVRAVDINGIITTVAGKGNQGDALAEGEFANETGHGTQASCYQSLGACWRRRWNGPCGWIDAHHHQAILSRSKVTLSRW